MNSSEQIDRLKAEAVAADIRIANDATVIAGLTAERDALARCKLSDQDAFVAMRDQRDAALKYASTLYRHCLSLIETRRDRIIAEGGEGDSFVTVEQALIAERDELRKALAAAEQGRDALQVLVTALESIANSDDGAGGEGMKLYIENRDMKSRLAALEKQEPVGEVDEDDSGLFVDLETPNGTVVKFGQKLYAAAGAAPVPTGHRLVSVEALTKWRNAFAEELSAWDIDPPLHHVQTSHDEISAILAAAPKEPT